MSLLSKMIMKVGSTDEGSFNYCLNDDETLRKMKINAKIKDVEVLPLKNDNTIRIQLSTGAYILTMAHLIKFLMSNVGKKFNVEVTKGLDITLDNVKLQSYIVGVILLKKSCRRNVIGSSTFITRDTIAGRSNFALPVRNTLPS